MSLDVTLPLDADVACGVRPEGTPSPSDLPTAFVGGHDTKLAGASGREYS